jgi:hypothetical protein
MGQPCERNGQQQHARERAQHHIETDARRADAIGQLAAERIRSAASRGMCRLAPIAMYSNDHTGRGRESTVTKTDTPTRDVTEA